MKYVLDSSVALKWVLYDCIYVALAEAQGCELAMADDQFARGLRASYPIIVSLAALP